MRIRAGRATGRIATARQRKRVCIKREHKGTDFGGQGGGDAKGEQDVLTWIRNKSAYDISVRRSSYVKALCGVLCIVPVLRRVVGMNRGHIARNESHGLRRQVVNETNCDSEVTKLALHPRAGSEIRPGISG